MPSDAQHQSTDVPRPWPECRDFDAHQLLRLAITEDTARAEMFRRIAAKLEGHQWRPIETAPRDGTRCLFYAPANAKAGNENAHRPQMRVDLFSARWPRAMHQLPEAPYTHWMPLPEPPHA